MDSTDNALCNLFTFISPRTVNKSPLKFLKLVYISWLSISPLTTASWLKGRAGSMLSSQIVCSHCCCFLEAACFLLLGIIVTM